MTVGRGRAGSGEDRPRVEKGTVGRWGEEKAVTREFVNGINRLRVSAWWWGRRMEVWGT